MYYLDPQKTKLRRDSSLIRPKTVHTNDAGTELNCLMVNKCESSPDLNQKRTGMVQKELIRIMFASMLNFIVESWEPIQLDSESSKNTPTSRLDSGSTTTVVSAKKKKSGNLVGKSKSLLKGRVSKMDDLDSNQGTPGLCLNEMVIIRFRNGNLYEGNISGKAMNGEGRFQWADGTVYLGNFNDNEIVGQGKIVWKDDTWYQGEFAGNLRHGKGLYVDSRLQRSYIGEWHYGTKHGQGVIYYSETFKNSYDGHWEYNERFGYGKREYSNLSGYKGEWERNIREGKGLMIWPNHDFYHGDWKNGVMSGYGIYIWETCYNNSMSPPSLKAYRGFWERGKRNGYGFLNFGTGFGSFYKGQFKNNNKHGEGQLVTNDGLILEHKYLFIDDNIGPYNGKINGNQSVNVLNKHTLPVMAEPYAFNICDSTVGLGNHIAIALRNLDIHDEIIKMFVIDYIQNNKSSEEVQRIMLTDSKKTGYIEEKKVTEQFNFQDFFTFEEISLHKAITYYTTDLKKIYYKYATICNTEEIQFTPIMIRLYLWQLFYDCKIHEKGMTLYDIDEIFYENREWLARRPHDPFEKIYFWQFLHSLLLVGIRLYAKRKMPDQRPDTVVASGFRTFMEQDLLPCSTHHRGHLVNGYGTFIPLKATYSMFENLGDGEPKTIRSFISAVRHSKHLLGQIQPPITDAPDKCIPCGRNVYIIADEMVFTTDTDDEIDDLPMYQEMEWNDMKLFNLANISTKTVIKKFANIFPQVLCDGKIMDLEVKLTFFEFFEVLIQCIQESIRVKEEEIKWRHKFSSELSIVPRSTCVLPEYSHKDLK